MCSTYDAGVIVRNAVINIVSIRVVDHHAFGRISKGEDDVQRFVS